MIELTIPEELLEWATQPEVEVGFGGAWGTELRKLVDRGGASALGHRDTEHMLSLVTALCREAIRAGRKDLVSGLDMFLAEWIGLSYTLTLEDGRQVEIGRKGRYTWSELRPIVSSRDPSSALAFAEKAKDLLADAFPGVRLGPVTDQADLAVETCASCGSPDAQVMIATEYGAHHCGPCWASLVEVRAARPSQKAKR